MRLVHLTLESPAENLALDEALLDEAEQGDSRDEIVRTWQPRDALVVLGRSSRLVDEVHANECQRRGIPIFRRASGGATIVTGPGCLMYAVVLSYDRAPALRSIDAAHAYVLGRMARALGRLVPGITRQGTSDLALGECKFSGNSLRCKRRHLLYHGTILYDFPLDLVTECLKMPPRQPNYRARRDHRTFLINLPLGEAPLRQAIASAFGAHETTDTWPRERVQSLVREKYSRPEWNLAR